MSENQGKQVDDENTFPVDEKVGINDGVEGDDNIDDKEIEEHDKEYNIVDNIKQNQQEPTQKSNSNKNDEEDVKIDDDVNDVLNHETDRDKKYNEGLVQRAIFRKKSTDTILKIIDLFPMEVHHKNKLGNYPLHTACYWRLDKVVMKLIE